jgi:hypothetical protein
MKPIEPQISRHRAGDLGPPYQPSGLGLRLRVRFRRWRLDRELADGCASEGSEDRAVRARQLAHPDTRHVLACSLREVVAETEKPRAALLSSAVPVLRGVVTPWREALLGLADRLEQPVPLNACGVARVQALVTDGAGPVYNRTSERTMGEAIWWAADGLALCPPHDWSCPVIMKLDPDHVGWTCARCGAIATTDDSAVGPE